MFDVDLARKFLLRNYDPALKLVRASPEVEPNVYYHYNDNYLAMLALRDYSQVSSILANQIQKSPTARIVVLDGQPFDVTWANETVTLFTLADKIVKTEVKNLMLPQLSVDQYADIAAFNVIGLHGLGLVNETKKALVKALGLFFDGVGIIDDPLKKLYNVYKSALFIVAAQRISYYDKNIGQLLNFVAGAQVGGSALLHYGGVIADFDGSKYVGDTNTETTADSILAFKDIV